MAGPSNLLAAVALLAIVAPAAWSTLGLRSAQGLFASLVQTPAAAPSLSLPAGAAAAPPAAAVNPAQLAALERAMGPSNAPIAEEGLTIGRLAHRHGVPQYRLRRLINQGPGPPQLQRLPEPLPPR